MPPEASTRKRHRPEPVRHRRPHITARTMHATGNLSPAFAPRFAGPHSIVRDANRGPVQHHAPLPAHIGGIGRRTGAFPAHIRPAPVIGAILGQARSLSARPIPALHGRCPARCPTWSIPPRFSAASRSDPASSGFLGPPFPARLHRPVFPCPPPGAPRPLGHRRVMTYGRSAAAQTQYRAQTFRKG